MTAGNGIRGAVAAGHPATAAAAAEMLADGGNAFDAALAALCAAPVAEPVLASLGGGGFLLARPAEADPVLYDFFCQTPQRKRPAADLDFYPVDVDFGTTTQEFHIGMGAVATPGTVGGLFAVHGDLATLPLARIVEPAIRLARDGEPVHPVQASILDIVEPIFVASESARSLFECPDLAGRVLREGDLYHPKALAGTLAALADEGADLFYRGEIGAELIAACETSGGMLTAADLGAYEVIRRSPLERTYNRARILGNPPPSSGGPLIAFALAMLEDDGFPAGVGPAPARAPTDDPGWLVRLADAMATTDAARTGCGLDEACDDLAVAALLSDPVIAEYRSAMRGRALKRGGTTHVSVIDAAGNAAAMSVSNGEGCGHILAGCGIMPNNMLGEEDINPRGFNQWTPDTRISSMMAPTIVVEPDGGRLTALGSGGSNRIRTAILQVLINLLRFDMGLATAIEAPRIHFERGLLNIEAVGADGGFDPADLAPLNERFQDTRLWDDYSMFYGGVHAVALDPATGRLDGAGDPRRGGVYQAV